MLPERLSDDGLLVRTSDPADRRIARLALPRELAQRAGAYRDRRLVALGAKASIYGQTAPTGVRTLGSALLAQSSDRSRRLRYERCATRWRA